MIAIECFKNGNKLATAGGKDVVLLLAILRWCRGDGEAEETDIEVCGQRGMDHLVWADVKLKRGDEIVLRLVDVDDSDLDLPEKMFRIP